MSISLVFLYTVFSLMQPHPLKDPHPGLFLRGKKSRTSKRPPPWQVIEKSTPMGYI
jgi:hypothetical protein